MMKRHVLTAVLVNLDKGPRCLSFDYARCFNNTVHTCSDVPKHGLYRYTDAETITASWMLKDALFFSTGIKN